MKIINRIKSNTEFGLTIKKGKTFRGDGFLIHARKSELGYTRVGLSVSTKLGKAVTRNRIKRQVRAMCDDLIDYNAQCLDLVIIIKPSFLEKTFNDNKSLLCDLLTLQVGINK